VVYTANISELRDMAKQTKPKTVFVSGNTSKLTVAESLRKDAGIKYLLVQNALTEIQVKGDVHAM
jgi:ABC-type Zn uptake system ZnuABC Zn-binding protein ZnuA